MTDRTLLHISHTDIRYDSRILKELDALKNIPRCKVYAIGVEAGSNSSSEVSGAGIITIKLLARVFRRLPRVFRYSLYFLELFIRMTFKGLVLRPNVVHCHDTLVLPMGIVIKLLSGGRLIYDAHELESEKTGQTRILSKVTLWIEKICWRNVDVLISVSDSIIDWYKKNLGKKNSVLILNSPRVSDLGDVGVEDHHANRYFRDRYRVPDDKRIFIYLGMLSDGRGIRACLAAFADPDITDHVVFMGAGVLDDVIDSYHSQHQNIHRHDPVPHEQVVAYARGANFGLCFVENASLSYYYCLPNKLFEYAFAGLPVLASDFPEIRKVIDKYSLGVCCAPEVEDIKRAISAAGSVEHFDDRSALAELGWPVQAERLLTAYNTLLRN